MNRFYLLLIVIGLALSSTSCVKEDAIWGSTMNSHRISQATYYNGGIEYAKDVFSYADDKLMTITRYTKGGSLMWEESGITEMSYVGDEVNVSWFEWDGDLWNNTNQASYLVHNGLLMEEVDYDQEGNYWVARHKWSYSYSHSNLVSWEQYDLADGDVAILVNKGEYLYQNGLLAVNNTSFVNGSGFLEPSQSVSYDYSAGLRTGYTIEDIENGDVVNTSYMSYGYAGGLMNSSALSRWNGFSWVADGPTLYYYHNALGFLAEEVQGVSRTVYDYELGSGNARFYWYYPEELVLGRPTIKNASSAQIIPFYQKNLK